MLIINSLLRLAAALVNDKALALTVNADDNAAELAPTCLVTSAVSVETLSNTANEFTVATAWTAVLNNAPTAESKSRTR